MWRRGSRISSGAASGSGTTLATARRGKQAPLGPPFRAYEVWAAPAGRCACGEGSKAGEFCFAQRVGHVPRPVDRALLMRHSSVAFGPDAIALLGTGKNRVRVPGLPERCFVMRAGTDGRPRRRLQTRCRCPRVAAWVFGCGYRPARAASGSRLACGAASRGACGQRLRGVVAESPSEAAHTAAASPAGGGRSMAVSAWHARSLTSGGSAK